MKSRVGTDLWVRPPTDGLQEFTRQEQTSWLK